MSELERAVEAVVGDCLRIGQGEQLLVVCNPATESIGKAMRDAGRRVGAESVLAVIDERDSHAAEPPTTVSVAMLDADVVLAPTDRKSVV